MDNPPDGGYKHLMSAREQPHDGPLRDRIQAAGARSPVRTDTVSHLIDSHVHVWDPARLEYPWLANVPALGGPHGLADLDPDARGLAGLVVVEAGCSPQQALAEVAWVESLAASWPVIRGMVAHAPLELGPEALIGFLPHLAEGKGIVVGVRRNVQDEPAGFLTASAFVAGVSGLAEFDLPFDACVREHQLRELIELVDRTPAVVVLDHLGKPDIRTHGRSAQPQRSHAWFADVTDLARRPNVVAKLSGLTTEADRDGWRDSDLRPYLLHAIEVFGPDRCLFGSDWPVATLATTYERWRDFVEGTIADLSSAARAAILSGTAERVYRLT
jgi:L-fuconolactonase